MGQQQPDGADVRATMAHEHGGSLLVAVRVMPHAGRQAIEVVDGALRVRLTASPVEGAANHALIALFSRRLRLPKYAIRLVRGATSRDKLLAITGLSLDAFWARLRVG